MKSAAVVAEAGVIVHTRDLEGALRYLCIHRPDDWSLPKGHWNAELDATLEATAVRELEEEAGVSVGHLAPAGVFTYETTSDVRQVRYFFGTYSGTAVPPHALDGVDEVRWLPRAQLAELLTHDDLGEFFLAVTAPAASAPWAPTRSKATTTNIRPGAARMDRLTTAIDVFAHEVAAIRARSAADELEASAWRRPGDRLLHLAAQLSDEGKIDAAWEALHSAQRLSLLDLSDEDVQNLAASRRSEAHHKLNGWRREAVDTLLDQPTQHASSAAHPAPSCTTGVSRDSLVEATRLMDEASSNVYLKLRLGGAALPIAAGLLFTILVLLVVAVSFDWFGGLRDVDGTFVLTDRGLLGGVMVLGAFGSMLSTALDTDGASLVGRRIYELAFAHIAIPVARLAIGAGSGVLVVAATQSTLAEGGQLWAVLTAIPAGFSERLVRQSVETLDVTAEGRPAPRS